jgi:transposase-like protein
MIATLANPITTTTRAHAISCPRCGRRKSLHPNARKYCPPQDAFAQRFRCLRCKKVFTLQEEPFKPYIPRDGRALVHLVMNKLLLATLALDCEKRKVITFDAYVAQILENVANNLRQVSGEGTVEIKRGEK